MTTKEVCQFKWMWYKRCWQVWRPFMVGNSEDTWNWLLKYKIFRGYFFHCSNCFTVFMVIPLAVLRIQSFKDTDLCRGWQRQNTDFFSDILNSGILILYMIGFRKEFEYCVTKVICTPKECRCCRGSLKQKYMLIGKNVIMDTTVIIKRLLASFRFCSVVFDALLGSWFRLAAIQMVRYEATITTTELIKVIVIRSLIGLSTLAL